MAERRQHFFQRCMQTPLSNEDFRLENRAYETVTKVGAANTEVDFELLIPMPAECGLGVVAVYENAVYIEQDVRHRMKFPESCRNTVLMTTPATPKGNTT